MFSHLPEIVHGIDVATVSVKSNGFPIALSATTYDIPTLKMLGCTSVFCRHDDPEAKKVFHYDDSWWNGNFENSPSKLARDLTFGDKNCAVLIPDALTTFSDYINKYWRNNRQVLASKTPNFDVDILLNAIGTCGTPRIDMLQRPTLIDNAHTALRSLMFMQMEPDQSVEYAQWTKGKGHVEHYAPHEAAEAGYITARYYHLLYINSIDPKLGREAHELMRQGKYDYIEFAIAHPEVKGKKDAK